MRASLIVLTTAMFLAIAGNAQAALLYFDNDAADGNWLNPINWSDEKLPTPGTNGPDDDRVPTSSDEISLDGNAVTVAGPAVYDDFNVPDTGGSLTINSGGYLTTNGGFYGAWGLSSITINSGGTFFNNPNSAEQIRSTTNLNTGGTLEGFTRLRNPLNINGGTFKPWNQVAPNGFEIDSILNLNAGIIELDVFSGGGSGSEYFDVFSGDTLNINNPAGEIVLVPQGGYIPTPGDSFDLWESLGTVNFLSDASNISIQGYSYEWDLSQFASDGILSIAIPPVPEPSSVCLLGLGALAMLRYTRRRRRNS